jgi:hypothetical protein
MKRILLICSVCFCAFTSTIAYKSEDKNKTTDSKDLVKLTSAQLTALTTRVIDSIYEKANLAVAGLQRNVFAEAYKGYQYLISVGKVKRAEVLTIVDYSKPSNERRLFVIDMLNGSLLYNTFVAHGKNSGAVQATSFSNTLNSNKTSLGFMVTAETYIGSKGYSMRIDGMEDGINDNVRDRAVVMHGSAYVNEERANSGTMIGRSFGCPALSYREHKEIIDEIKNGSCFFAYYPDMNYTSRSKIINADFEWPALAAMNISSKGTSDSEMAKAFPSVLPASL